jgi:uncharacterized membrane protein
MTYLVLKLLHVLAAISFFGNITLGLFWQAQASRTRDARALAFTLETIARSDRFFTKPGAIGLLATGLAIAYVGGFPIVATGWILWTLVIFLAGGAIYGALAGPARKQLLALAQRDAQAGTFSEAEHAALSKRFHRWVGVAWATPVIGLVLMVLKPF